MTSQKPHPTAATLFARFRFKNDCTSPAVATLAHTSRARIEGGAPRAQAASAPLRVLIRVTPPRRRPPLRSRRPRRATEGRRTRRRILFFATTPAPATFCACFRYPVAGRSHAFRAICTGMASRHRPRVHGHPPLRALRQNALHGFAFQRRRTPPCSFSFSPRAAAPKAQRHALPGAAMAPESARGVHNVRNEVRAGRPGSSSWGNNACKSLAAK